MNILDIVLIIFVILGAIRGFKYGMFRSGVSLVGTFLIFFLAFILKNPLSTFLYEHLPFYSFGGLFKGVSSFNILFYEAVSYVICFLLLGLIYKLVMRLTGLLDKLINITIILALPSKLIGLVLGSIQFYIIGFIAVFVLANIPQTNKYFNDSYMGTKIMDKTPLLSGIVSDTYKSVDEIYNICVKHKKDENREMVDYESIDTLLKYDVVSLDNVKELVKKDKLKINNIDELVNKYESKVE